jgi:glutamate/tyrosine decarboxylase-like PLP-dependent enzyme
MWYVSSFLVMKLIYSPTLQPYDCGFFVTRSLATLSSVFQNPNAAYLASGPSLIPSPLNIGLENSRRFRALPVYSVLLAYGRDGLAEMFARQVRLARGVVKFLDESESYEILPKQQAARPAKPTAEVSTEQGEKYLDTHIIILFRARDENINVELVKRTNATRKMYVSGTKWDGKPACRIAVSTWRVEVERDLELVTGVLEEVLKSSD